MSFTEAIGYAAHDLRVYGIRDFVVNSLAASRLVLRPVRYLLYRMMGIRTATMNIRPGCRFKFRRVSIGRDTFVNDCCAFENFAEIAIGERCAIGPEVMFCSTTHEPGTADRRGGAVVGAPVRVGDGCWIGARALILPGVEIGDGCVVAAGAVVTQSCAPHGVYAGVPARRVRDLPV